MSAIKKGWKKVTGFVKKYWKEIVIAAAIVFTAGIATVGLGAYTSAIGTQGFWAATGSTMWAGATSIAGTMGIGSGAQGSVAAASGMQGATLGTGAWAQGLGWAEAPAAAGQAGAGAQGATQQSLAGLGGPGASGYSQGAAGSSLGSGSQMAGMGPLSNKAYAAQAGGNAGGTASGVSRNVGSRVSNPGNQASRNVGQRGAGGGGSEGGLMRDMAVAATPSLIQAGGAYFSAKGEEEARKPKALWGVDFESGKSYQPDSLKRSTGVPRQQPEGPQPTSEAFSGHMAQAQQLQPGQRFIGGDGQEYEVGPDGQPRPVRGLMDQQPGHVQYGVG